MPHFHSLGCWGKFFTERYLTGDTLVQNHSKGICSDECYRLWCTAGIKYWKAAVAESCPTLCNPMDCSPSGSFVRGIFQARTLEQVACPFSRGSSQPRDQCCFSCVEGILCLLSLQNSDAGESVHSAWALQDILQCFSNTFYWKSWTLYQLTNQKYLKGTDSSLKSKQEFWMRR